jgi:hypothetical protein
MQQQEIEQVLKRVREHAFSALDWKARQSTNLYVDTTVRETNKHVGPEFQGIVVGQPTIVVFADDRPLANFAHLCRYLLYDARNGEFAREVTAQFPPFLERVPDTLMAIHEPIRLDPNPAMFHIRWPLRCPIIVPDGNRYAILFSGMSNLRHLNDLEFLYRTLRYRYGFAASDIYALNYDGKLNTQDGVPGTWPGDGTAYQIKVTGPGTQAGFEAAIDDLKGKLKSRDMLLIHTNNHGGNNGPGQSYLCTYPSWSGYFVTDFANKLGQLPKYRSLIVMMEQCFAGGFNAPILAKSTADATSVASAVTEFESSWGTSDGHWDYFARDWISAQAGHDPYGAALASNPDTDVDGRIQAEEAFGYANTIHYSGDSPNFSESSEAGGDIALGQEYVVWWWWCRILWPLLERHYAQLPIPEFYEALHRIQPELSELVASIDQAGAELRKEVEPKLESVIASTFGERK